MVIYRYHILLDGAVIEEDVVTATKAEWAASPESHSPDWYVSRAGRKVRAVRLTIPTCLLASSVRADQPARPSLDFEPSRN
jgi:hypothetical protein